MSISDWSSDVCSSDLGNEQIDPDSSRGRPVQISAHRSHETRDVRRATRCPKPLAASRAPEVRLSARRRQRIAVEEAVPADRKSVVSGKSVSVRVELGGLRTINKQINNKS